MTPATRPVPAVAVGQAVPRLERTFGLPDLVAYAGATWDWHRLHYDPAYAAKHGLPGPVVDGQALGAVLAETVLDWLGPRAVIRRLRFRLKSPVFAGERFQVEGEVTDLQARGPRDLATLALRITVGERLAVDPASVEVEILR